MKTESVTAGRDTKKTIVITDEDGKVLFRETADTVVAVAFSKDNSAKAVIPSEEAAATAIQILKGSKGEAAKLENLMKTLAAFPVQISEVIFNALKDDIKKIVVKKAILEHNSCQGCPASGKCFLEMLRWRNMKQ